MFVAATVSALKLVLFAWEPKKQSVLAWDRKMTFRLQLNKLLGKPYA